MKKIITIFILLLTFASSLSVSAAGTVTYDGNAKEFIFAPGSDYSPTDLFTDFKDVMPGGSISQEITVKNAASNKVKVKIYMRSLGAHEDSVDFLSQLGLRVQKSENNQMAYMFDAAASETAQLQGWVCLGTLYSGGEVTLDVILDVPAELDNSYSNRIGYLDWEFMIEEFPIEESDPKPPQTGDSTSLALPLAILIGSAALIFICIIIKFRKKEEPAHN